MSQHDHPIRDEKLAMILDRAAKVFAEQGFHRASIRDVAAAAGVSLSGMYYHITSKEQILYLIQRECLQSLLDAHARAMESLARYTDGVDDPEARLRVVARNHLDHLSRCRNEMRVLFHEADVLEGEYGERIRDLRNRYVGLVSGVLEELHQRGAPRLRLAAHALIAMMNRVHTWHHAEPESRGEELEDEVVELFLHGFIGGAVHGAGPEDGPREGMGGEAIGASPA